MRPGTQWSRRPSATWWLPLALLVGLSACGGDPRRTEKVDPTSGPDAALEAAASQGARGDRKGAAEALAAALQRFPGDRARLCPAYRLAARRAGAWRGWLGVGACGTPADANDERTTWLAQAATGGAERAAASLRAALVERPDDGPLLATLAGVHWLAGEAVAAHLIAGRALARLGGAAPDGVAWQLALEVRARAAALVAPTEANAAFERALEADPRSPVALAWAGFLLHHARVDEAEARLSAWLADQPDDPDAQALQAALDRVRPVLGEPPAAGGPAAGDPRAGDPGAGDPGAADPVEGPAPAKPDAAPAATGPRSRRRGAP